MNEKKYDIYLQNLYDPLGLPREKAEKHAEWLNKNLPTAGFEFTARERMEEVEEDITTMLYGPLSPEEKAREEQLIREQKEAEAHLALYPRRGPQLFCPDGYDVEYMEKEYFAAMSTEEIADREDWGDDIDGEWVEEAYKQFLDEGKGI